MVMILEEEVMTVICAYRPQPGTTDCEKNQFYNEVSCEWDLQNPGEW